MDEAPATSRTEPQYLLSKSFVNQEGEFALSSPEIGDGDGDGDGGLGSGRLLLISNASGARESRPNSVVVRTTIYVDKSGSGNYASVQKAIDSVPDNNNQWIRIHIKPGTYNEKVKIPITKQYIFLEGESSETTTIQYLDAGKATEAATFQVYADNIVASNITFKNSYSTLRGYVNNTRITWAPAALITGDKVSFRRCSFHSIQDTLADLQGRHYFDSCFISGAIDFIWGRGQSLYKNCVVKTVASHIGMAGYIMAQGRDGPNDPSAFVFQFGMVAGHGSTYLGRAWRQYSRVLFYRTYMSKVVVPQGWSPWNFQGHEDDITFAETGCTGDGADNSRRVKWMKHLPPQELTYLLSKNFMNQEGWVEAQP
ncbi:hypothetical protein NL676_030495 [Syzygium grande]|nr:hypothetical protein NL676_030495 [Syzygium grande]